MKRKLLFSLLLLAGMTLSAGAEGAKKINIEYNNGLETLTIDRSKIKKITFTEEDEKTDELTFTIGDVSFTMVKVEAGTFTMGATKEMTSPYSDEKPTHQVTLTTDYYIGKTEVTQALWTALMESNPSEFQGDKLPVENVSYGDITDTDGFLDKLNAKTGKTFRLPTEAEWEFAARGGNKSKGFQYSGSNTLSDVAWYQDNSENKTHEVATKQANELGIYDMSGNVWEWCADLNGSYSSEDQTDPTGPESGTNYYINRGGCWRVNARNCRSSRRQNNARSDRNDRLGLRLALTAK